MRFEDPKSMLEAAAAKPSRGLDATALVQQGARLRRARLAAVASGVAVVLIAASASLGVLADGGRDDAAPGPAAPSPGCGDLQRADVRFRRDLSRREAEDIARAEEGLFSPGGVSIGTTLYGPKGVPRRLYISGVTEERLEEIERELESQIESVSSGTDEAALAECSEADPGRPSPGPAPTHTVVTSEDEHPDPVAVVLLRAECRSGSAAVVGIDAEFADGTKWCRFVVRIDNDGDAPVRFEMWDQVLRGVSGEAFAPWEHAMKGALSRRLFDAPIPPGGQTMGQLVFLLPPGEVPATLDVEPRPKFWTISVPLRYDCPADVRDEPRRRCSFGPGSR